MVDAVALMILEYADQAHTGSMSGKLGQKFLEYIEQLKANEKQVEAVFDPETDAKIKFLKQCELYGDLGWIAYEHWNVLTLNVREEFIKVVDPLFWNGVYFQYSRFALSVTNILSGLQMDTAVYVLRQEGNYQIACMDSNRSAYMRVSDNGFQSVQKDFRSRMLYSIGISSVGLVVKECNERDKAGSSQDAGE